MKKSIKIIVPLILLLIFVGAFLYFDEFNDNMNYSFKNTTDSKYISLKENGWIPSIIPDDATNIEIFYNIDTNIVNGKFKLENENSLNNFKSLLSLSENKNFNFLNKNYENEVLKLLNENPTFKYEDFYFIFNNNNDIYFIK